MANKRMGYRVAVRWLVDNDDCSWLDYDESSPSVTAFFVMDCFNVNEEKPRANMKRVIEHG